MSCTAVDLLITYESLDAIGLALDPPALNSTDKWTWDRWQALTGDAAVLGDRMLEAAASRQILGLVLPQTSIVHRRSNACGWMWWCFDPQFDVGVLTNPMPELYQSIEGFPDMRFINAPSDTAGYHRCRVLCLLDTLGILPAMYQGIPHVYQLQALDLRR